MCVRCDGKGDNDTAVMNAVEKMKINEPHGLAMCSRIYARDETANEDQTVDFHGYGVEWRRIFEILSPLSQCLGIVLAIRFIIFKS